MCLCILVPEYGRKARFSKLVLGDLGRPEFLKTSDICKWRHFLLKMLILDGNCKKRTAFFSDIYVWSDLPAIPPIKSIIASAAWCVFLLLPFYRNKSQISKCSFPYWRVNDVMFSSLGKHYNFDTIYCQQRYQSIVLFLWELSGINTM